MKEIPPFRPRLVLSKGKYRNRYPERWGEGNELSFSRSV